MLDPKYYDKQQPLVIYDSECPLCCRSVRLILSLDHEKKFYFSGRNSLLTSSLLNEKQREIDALIFLINDDIYFGADAIIKAGEFLTFPGNMLTVIRFIPKKLRNLLYAFIAANRKKIFGGICRIPEGNFFR